MLLDAGRNGCAESVISSNFEEITDSAQPFLPATALIVAPAASGCGSSKNEAHNPERVSGA